MGGPDMAPQTRQRSEHPGEAVALLDTPTGSRRRVYAVPPRRAYFSKIVRPRRSSESRLLASGASGAAARRTRARTRSRRRRAQTNSVARIARPSGMTISAGPGRRIIAPPTRSTVPPITPIAIRPPRFSRGSRRPPKPQRCCPSMLDPPCLLFECAGDEPADQEPLEPDHDEHGRQARQHGRGGDVAPGHLVDAGEERERDRDRPARLRGRERVREEELVPAEQERQERGRGDPGREPGRHDPAERRDRAGAVDGRSLLGLAGNLADEPDEEPDRQRQRERGVDEDEARPGVSEADRAHQEVERAHGRDLRKRRARDDREEEGALAGQREPRDRVRAGHPHRERQEGRQRRDPHAVHERTGDQALLEHDAIMRERQPARQERRGAPAPRPRAGRRQERPERTNRARARPPEGPPGGPGLVRAAHATTARAPSSRRYAHATPITSAKTTTLTAEPKPSWSIWKRLR